jgi:hypothetical protein
MRLLAAHFWVEKYFSPESRPAEITLLRWLREGKIPCKKIGGKWYVDEHEWLAGGDPLVQHVLERS